MSDLYMFRDGQTLEEVKEVTSIYENNRGQQDVFMQCLKEAYKMGYLQWKEMMRIETKGIVWECGDGCCRTYDIVLYINGKEVKDRLFCDTWEAYQYVLEEVLDHEIGVIYDDAHDN